MKNIVIDFNETVEKSKSLEIHLLKMTLTLHVLISIENCIEFLSNIEKGMSNQEAFYCFICTMYHETKKVGARTIPLRKFYSLDEADSLRIMQLILEENKDIPSEFWDTNINNIYERFKKYITNYSKFRTEELICTINNVTSTILKQISSDIYNGIKQLGEALQESIDNLYKAMLENFEGLKKGILSYYKLRSDLDPDIRVFGWGGISTIPVEIISFIHSNKSQLTCLEVDRLVVDFFTRNDFKQLNSMVSEWWGNEYFSRRRIALAEAIECYKKHYYIASVTLLTLYMEGSIKDFLNEVCGIQGSNNKQSMEDIRTLEISCPERDISYYHECRESNIEEIQTRLTQHFSIDKPDAASKFSRHRIGHGQMYEEISEADALKSILHMNELNNLLGFLADYLRKEKTTRVLH